MGIGFGSLKHMNDTIRQNREMLGKKKKKSLRDRYKEEAQKASANVGHADPEEVRMRVRQNVRRSTTHTLYARISAVTAAIFILGGLVWIFATFDFRVRKDANADKPSFIVRNYVIDEGRVNRHKYFQSGALAAETLLIDGKKHPESKSFYESGEVFRLATYFNDTLLVETYFLKNGDTIKNISAIDTSVRHISVKDPKSKKFISFDLFDGKIVEKSYAESELEVP